MKTRWVVLIAVATFSLTACGGGTVNTGSSSTTEATTNSEEVEVSSRQLTAGEEKYSSTCVGCHGSDAQGVEGVGKPLAGTTFINDKSTEDLVAFIKTGRGPSDPENTTGLQMPPSGGNPSLSDDDLTNIVAYLKSLG